MTFDVDVAPRFDYGRRGARGPATDAGAVFVAGDDALTVHAVREPRRRAARTGSR